jgi:hypothetical protein
VDKEEVVSQNLGDMFFTALKNATAPFRRESSIKIDPETPAEG